jgi:hypothetical protein
VDAFAEWESTRLSSFFDPALATGDPAVDARLRAFGELVAQVVEPAVAELEAGRGLPAVDGARVEFGERYAEAGRALWASGVLSAGAFRASGAAVFARARRRGWPRVPGRLHGRVLVRALRAHASDALRERFLPPLLGARLRPGAARRAVPHRARADRTSGRTGSRPSAPTARGGSRAKWFCSVADAHQFVVTARPRGAAEGTRGIACFLVPRVVDGAVSGFRIRRLKDKLGTRALATGEIEFDSALGYPMGALEDGFQIAAGVVLNTSRWLNAFGSTGLMRRAYLEAARFSRVREAFGRPIVEYLLVRENLAVTKVEAQAALASSLELTTLVERIDAGTATDDDIAWHRLLVNANKFVTSIAATGVVRRGIEALGGNGTIEDFSPLPRLYRDAIVFESWEGTHNVLCAQVLRDLARMDAVQVAVERAGGSDELAARLQRSVAEPDFGALHIRRQLDELVRTLKATCLRRAGNEPAAELLIRRRLTPTWNPERDAAYAALLDRILEPDTA